MSTEELCCKYISEYKNTGILNIDVLLFAANYGHLDCMKFAYENGCPWNVYTISFAANYGHLDCMKFAYENSCSLNEEKTLPNLEKHASKIDLDDKWWISFLFIQELSKYPKLERIVKEKKEEIKDESKILYETHLVLKDIVKYIIFSFI
jgi:hypothetical protein